VDIRKKKDKQRRGEEEKIDISRYLTGEGEGRGGIGTSFTPWAYLGKSVSAPKKC